MYAPLELIQLVMTFVEYTRGWMKSDDKNRPPDPHLSAAAETERVDQPSAGATGRSAEELQHELRMHQTFNRYCTDQTP